MFIRLFHSEGGPLPNRPMDFDCQVPLDKSIKVALGDEESVIVLFIPTHTLQLESY